MNRPMNGPMLLCVALLAGAALAKPETAVEIMQRSEDNRHLKDVTAAATLTTSEEGKPDRVKTFTWWRKLTDAGRFNTLTRFATPPEVRGEGILFLERDRDTNDVFLFLPNMNKVRRVESQSQRSSFMGSAFSYSDIAAQHVDDFEHTLVKTEPCPAETVSTCFVIESKPADEKVEERTGYRRIVQWIHPDHYLAVQGEFYGPAGELLKRITVQRIKKVDPAGGKWMAHHVRVEEVKEKRSTTLEFSQVKVNGGISDAVFTQQNLMQE
jgi:outer membrane lipoprotein-sorting protein